MNGLCKFLFHRFVNSPDRWYPFVSVYYLTYRCDFRCPYCSDGRGKPYHQLSDEVLSERQVLGVLKKIRKYTDYLILTGGEPLLHPEFKEIISNLRSVRYKEVVLTTNGFYVDRYLDEITQAVTTLVFSTDTLDAEKADALYGKGKGTFEKILNNLHSAAAHPARRYDITLSSVVTARGINDLYAVYEFSQKSGFTFAAAPRLIGVKAEQALVDNPDYRRFFDFLIGEKKKGGRIFGTACYLEYMRDLKKFNCRPFTMLVVSPLGDVFYPCLEIGHYAGKIQDSDTLHRIRSEGCNKHGPQPACDTRCHSACALSFTLLFERPMSHLPDLLSKMRLSAK
jgi:MoaA/NifB/PqqE/SkfB family radical SAM enzyme